MCYVIIIDMCLTSMLQICFNVEVKKIVNIYYIVPFELLIAPVFIQNTSEFVQSTPIYFESYNSIVCVL